MAKCQEELGNQLTSVGCIKLFAVGCCGNDGSGSSGGGECACDPGQLKEILERLSELEEKFDRIKPCECSENPETKVTIRLNEASQELPVESTFQLVATVGPADLADKSVTWVSSDPAIASVDDNGLVTAVTKGVATITATTNVGKKSAVCTVIVVEDDGSDITIRLSETAMRIPLGQEWQLTAMVGPEDLADKSVTWSSSDRSIARVDENGLIRVDAVGSVQITAKTNAGDKIAVCRVEVVETIETDPDFPLLGWGEVPCRSLNYVSMQGSAENAFDLELKKAADGNPEIMWFDTGYPKEYWEFEVKEDCYMMIHTADRHFTSARALRLSEPFAGDIDDLWILSDTLTAHSWYKIPLNLHAGKRYILDGRVFAVAQIRFVKA